MRRSAGLCLVFGIHAPHSAAASPFSRAARGWRCAAAEACSGKGKISEWGVCSRCVSAAVGCSVGAGVSRHVLAVASCRV
jgi:hypothetical protein